MTFEITFDIAKPVKIKPLSCDGRITSLYVPVFLDSIKIMYNVR